ncbi:glycosyltransferase [Acidobacteriia bacterium AH_259_A11_L15]|nr:glycosyltransferase [Acidobacteriia bacterium AH_259_A11_L15]
MTQWQVHIPKRSGLTSELGSNRIEGGLRTKGQFHKKSEPGSPLVSVITVVRDGEKYLEQTIQSILNQTYDNIEYIIVDGASTDGTLDIVRKYEEQIAYWISEPDQGLYDAMNKGSIIATGDYALYLHEGDYFSSSDSVERMFKGGFETAQPPLLIIGNMKMALNDELLDWVLPASQHHVSKYNPPFQGTFIASSIYKTIPYNTLFAIGADTYFWARLRQLGLFRFKYVDCTVAVHRLGGISNARNTEYQRYVEREIIRYIQARQFSVLRLLKWALLANVKKGVRSILGDKIYYKYMLYGVYLFRKRFL